MTDKEMADKYIKSKWSNLIAGTQLMLSEAYLDGLAEGKPKWHDLRVNPNDVPTEQGDYWVIDADGDYSLISNFVNTTHGDTAILFKAHDAIAWCELPKF